MHHRAIFCASMSNHYRDMVIFRFIKMATVHHLGVVYTPTWDQTRRVVGGLYCYAKFGWNRQCSFEDVSVSMLCKFACGVISPT